MSHALTEVAVNTASVVVPDPGQQVLANDIEVAAQALANRTKLLLDPYSGNRRRFVAAPPVFNSAFWEHSSTGLEAGNPLCSLAGSAGPSVDKRKVVYLLDVPQGSTLTHVQLWLKAAPLHGGVVQFPVGIRFEKQAIETGVVTAGAVVSDPSGLGTYESYHWLDLAVGEVIDCDTYRYYARVSNEGGTNAIEPGLALYGLAQLYIPGTYPGGL